jgi:protein ImuB
MGTDLLACIDVPALPLQLLARGDPSLVDHPAVVVSEDRPQGVILWVNRAARAARILPGMRYAAGLALNADLRAGVVTPQEEQAGVEAIAAILRLFSPEVEPSRDEPGVCWVNASGLEGLFGSMQRWAAAVRGALLAQGFHASVAVGRGRFALYAITKHYRGLQVCADERAERALVDRVALASLGSLLGLEPATREAMTRLGVTTLGQFLALPEKALRERHGAAALQVHRRARGDELTPLRPEHPQPPPLAVRDLEPPDDNADRLLFLAKGMLAELLGPVAERQQAVAGLTLHLELEKRGQGAEPLREELRPAEATLNEAVLIDLVRLKLDALQLPSPVERLMLVAWVVPATAQQVRMWQLAGRRDLDAATLALARLRAAFGPLAVVHAQLRQSHLPEAQFAWQVLEKMQPPHPPPPPEHRTLVRRLYPKPQPLPSRPKHEPDGWLLSDWRQGSVVKLWGPFRLTGGWWVREVRRDYYYVETERGDLLWVFFDAVRRRWFLQGVVD